MSDEIEVTNANEVKVVEEEKKVVAKGDEQDKALEESKVAVQSVIVKSVPVESNVTVLNESKVAVESVIVKSVPVESNVTVLNRIYFDRYPQLDLSPHWCQKSTNPTGTFTKFYILYIYMFLLLNINKMQTMRTLPFFYFYRCIFKMTSTSMLFFFPRVLPDTTVSSQFSCPAQISSFTKHFRFFKVSVNDQIFFILFDETGTVDRFKSVICSITCHPTDSFYCSCLTKYLNNNKLMSDYAIGDKHILVNFRLKGGSNEVQEDTTSATFQPSCAQRAFFLDNENSPNTWLLLFEFSFLGHRYTPTTKAQQLLAFLPTEILQQLGSKILSLMNSDKFTGDVYQEICTLIKEFYKPSAVELFDKYFRTQSLGQLTPSQFLSKACNDLDRLQSGSSSNVDIIRRFFLSVLPPTARAILAGSEKSSLEDLALIADKIMLNLPSTPSISNIDTSLVELVKNLSDQVASLKTIVTENKRSRSPTINYSQNTFRSRSKSLSTLICTSHFNLRNNSKECCIGCNWTDKSNCKILPICIYHSLFARNAKRCLEGCTFTKN
jgi:hypothetical protein